MVNGPKRSILGDGEAVIGATIGDGAAVRFGEPQGAFRADVDSICTLASHRPLSEDEVFRTLGHLEKVSAYFNRSTIVSRIELQNVPGTTVSKLNTAGGGVSGLKSVCMCVG